MKMLAIFTTVLACLLRSSLASEAYAQLPVSCSEPKLDEASGIKAIGNGSSPGDIISFQCEKIGWEPDVDNATCLEDGEWSFVKPPMCFAVSCPDVLLELNGGKEMIERVDIPYGTTYLLTLGDFDPQQSDSDRVHLFGAKIATTCKYGADRQGDDIITCQADGSWSNSLASCTMPSEPCSSTAHCPGESGSSAQTKCCTAGSISPSGIGCCQPSTKEILSRRFAGLHNDCLGNLSKKFSICGSNFIDCLEKRRPHCQDSLIRFCDYGQNDRDNLPPPQADVASAHLQEFCDRHNCAPTIGCVETHFTSSEEVLSQTGVCVPSACLSEVDHQLLALAKSSLSFQCALENASEECSIVQLRLKCSDGSKASAGTLPSTAPAHSRRLAIIAGAVATIVFLVAMAAPYCWRKRKEQQNRYRFLNAANSDGT